MQAFDGADPFTSTDCRNVTTTPTQSLLMINGAWPLQRARAFASRLRRMRPADNRAMVEDAYRLAYSRHPTRHEVQTALSFLDNSTSLADVASSKTPQDLPLTGTIPGRDGMAALLKPGSLQRRLVAPNTAHLPDQDFTIEAVIVLHSLYPDATVRTIASQWDSVSSHPGWALGVTSTKSAYQPRNLILQMVGDPAKGGAGYEVIASNLRPELNKPYYVAASVRIADTSREGITFYLKELSRSDAPLLTANVTHKVTGHYRSSESFVIGGRSRSDRHLWDGLIGEVRLSNRARTQRELLTSGDEDASGAVGFWRFAAGDRFYRDASGVGLDLRPSGGAADQLLDASTKALVDFCHVLLNSNELIYVD
jgi:hypothetical protein